jgi:hypothetical protein
VENRGFLVLPENQTADLQLLSRQYADLVILAQCRIEMILSNTILDHTLLWSFIDTHSLHTPFLKSAKNFDSFLFV